MGLRGLLVALIVAATAAFVLGTAIERNTGESGHHDAPASGAPAAGEAIGGNATPAESGGDSSAAHAKETGSQEAGSESSGAPTTQPATGISEASAEASHAEFRPLGINIEAWPVVALAALISLGLAGAAWLRSQAAWLLALVALAMAAFTVLDVNEVAHQLDVHGNGLAALAAGIALLHGAAATVGATMAVRGWRRGTRTAGRAGAMPA